MCLHVLPAGTPNGASEAQLANGRCKVELQRVSGALPTLLSLRVWALVSGDIGEPWRVAQQIEAAIMTSRERARANLSCRRLQQHQCLPKYSSGLLLHDL